MFPKVMTEKKRKIILIFGRTGSGKSSYVKGLIKKISRLIVIDALHEYNDGIIFYTLQDFLDYLDRNLKADGFRYIIRFSNDEELELLFDLIFYIGNLTLVVEEAEIYISAYVKQSNFLRLIRYGRHKAISIIAVARRVTELSNDVRSQANQIISFKQILKKDIDYLKNLGFSKVEYLKPFEPEIVNY